MEGLRFAIYLDFRTKKENHHRIGKLRYSITEEDFKQIASILGKYPYEEIDVVEKDI